MDSSRGTRWVRVAIRCRRVTMDLPDGRRTAISYPGLLLTGYEDDVLAYEKWVPLGDESTEFEDERVIAALAEAFRWQNRELPP